MNIIVLDGYTLNPGDLSWDELQSLGTCTIYDRTPPELVVKRAQNAEILLTNKVILDYSILSQLPKLRYIGVLATGYNIVDIEAARAHGIVVTNVPAYGARSVAQSTFALLLELTNHVGEQSQGVRAGRWTKCIDFTYRDYPLIELDGLTMGIIGYGGIGKAVAALAQGFGMKVLVHTRTQPKTQDDRVLFVAKESLFRKSDVVSLHCPLTQETTGIVNAAHLALMKPTAFLINTGRGKLIIEQDLAEALNTGKIAGAGLDVLSEEPPKADNPLLAANNCVITPHIAGSTKAARQRLLKCVVENIRGFLSGTPQNAL